MDIAKEISQMEKDLIRIKSSQQTFGDSANYFSVLYSPGYFVDDTMSKWREHTIICKSSMNSDKAIFMPMFTANTWTMSGENIGCRLPTYSQDVITWWQDPITSQHLSDSSYMAGVANGFMIFSNVPFYIEASYIEKSI